MKPVMGQMMYDGDVFRMAESLKLDQPLLEDPVRHGVQDTAEWSIIRDKVMGEIIQRMKTRMLTCAPQYLPMYQGGIMALYMAARQVDYKYEQGTPQGTQEDFEGTTLGDFDDEEVEVTLYDRV